MGHLIHVLGVGLDEEFHQSLGDVGVEHVYLAEFEEEPQDFVGVEGVLVEGGEEWLEGLLVVGLLDDVGEVGGGESLGGLGGEGGGFELGGEGEEEVLVVLGRGEVVEVYDAVGGEDHLLVTIHSNIMGKEVV